MKISYIKKYNKFNFKSRNAKIRLADDIARKVNKEFPRLSASKIDDFKHIKKYRKFQIEIWQKILSMRKDYKKKFYSSHKFLSKIDSILIPIKQNKIGNCTESTYLSAIIAKANGIKNCYPATITNPHGHDFNHRVLFVNDKKPYIIDAWLGFADYLPQANIRYIKDFHNNFDFEKIKTKKMCFPKYKTIFFEFMQKDFTPEETKTILLKYPNLKLER